MILAPIKHIPLLGIRLPAASELTGGRKQHRNSVVPASAWDCAA